MILFWAVAAVMVATALAMILPTLWRGGSESVAADRDGQNISIARERYLSGLGRFRLSVATN